MIAIIGEVLSGPTIAAAGVANALAVPLLSPTASEERISSIGPYIFQLTQSISWQGTAVAAYAIQKMSLKTMAVLYCHEATWETVAKDFSQETAKLGGQVILSLYYEPGTTDFKPIIEKLRVAKIQALFIPAPPTDVVMIAPQLAYNQIKVQLLGTDAWADPKILAQGDVYVEGAIFATLSSSSGLAQAAASFEDRYKKRFNKPPSKLAAQGYDGAKIMLAALQKNPASRAELKTMLQQADVSFVGVSGQIAFGKFGAAPKAKIMVIRNKQAVELE